jgi:hypothetical protein
MNYSPAFKRGDGWWFTRELGDGTKIEFGPHPSEDNCYYNRERLLRYDALSSGGANQINLFDAPSWRQTVQDIFGITSIEAFPSSR